MSPPVQIPLSVISRNWTLISSDSAYFLWKLVRKNSLWSRFFDSALNHWEAIDYESIDNNLSKAFDPKKKFDLKVLLRPSKLRCIDLRSRYFPIWLYCRVPYSKCAQSQIADDRTVDLPFVNDHIGKHQDLRSMHRSLNVAVSLGDRFFSSD